MAVGGIGAPIGGAPIGGVINTAGGASFGNGDGAAVIDFASAAIGASFDSQAGSAVIEFVSAATGVAFNSQAGAAVIDISVTAGGDGQTSLVGSAVIEFVSAGTGVSISSQPGAAVIEFVADAGQAPINSQAGAAVIDFSATAGQAPIVDATGSVTQWDVTRASRTDLAISNNGYTVTSITGTFYAGTRSYVTRSGKIFYRATSFGGSQQAIGFADSGWDDQTVSGSHWLGDGVTSVGFWTSDSTVWYGGNQIYSTGLGLSGNNVIDVVIDTSAKLFWVRVDSGLWNNDAAANPATGTNGISVPGIGSPLYAGLSTEGVGSGVIADFSPSFQLDGFSQFEKDVEFSVAGVGASFSSQAGAAVIEFVSAGGGDTAFDAAGAAIIDFAADAGGSFSVFSDSVAEAIIEFVADGIIETHRIRTRTIHDRERANVGSGGPVGTASSLHASRGRGTGGPGSKYSRLGVSSKRGRGDIFNG